MNKQFVIYEPYYSFKERVSRYITLSKAILTGLTKKLIHSEYKPAGSIEITDRCNAGCQHCYVYPPEWNQKQRMQGYLELSSYEHSNQERQVERNLKRLKEQGVIHLVVVGGEPALVPQAIQRAAELFPLVWVVTNGVAKLPQLPRSAVIFVSIDGSPDYHNRIRDPLGYFAAHRYENLTGMSAAIVRNINESERGAFCQITLTPQSLSLFPETVDWLIHAVKKLRGIIVFGATAKDPKDPLAFKLEDRQLLKQMITTQAKKYGWNLFPFNQPKVNEFLFDEKYILYHSASCPVAKQVISLGFDGKNVGKCLLRDDASCETCVAGMTGVARAVERFDFPTILGILRASFG
jgi:sulfatase maturation enzyme AslB (radical SAM superfamily)